MNSLSRRGFLRAAGALGAGSLFSPRVGSPEHTQGPGPSRPVVISSPNGLPANERAMAMIKDGSDPLDAVVAGVNIVEEDPTDHSVGYGGLPNEDGVVELDSCLMHGPTKRGGAVASLRGIKTPSKVAKLVMERTDHVLLVGEGALRFAKAHGFEEVDLLTDEARRIWLDWKENLSDRDDWLPPEELAEELEGSTASASARRRPRPRLTGTINCNAVDTNGNIAGVTTTSGLAYKIPGRVGDSPIIGAGLYVDNEVGACGSTGRGEANLLNLSSFLIVENMRNGMSPEEAGVAALERIADKTEPRLRDRKGRPAYQLSFYALNKRGEYAGVAMWSGQRQYAVHDGIKNQSKDFAYLYKAES